MAKARVVIGTWPLSGDFGPINLRNIQDSLEYCYSLGLKEFDTAPSYGNGFMEFCLGKVFAGKDDVLINTKIGNVPFYGKKFETESLRRSFEESLQRLSIDQVNVLYLHNPRDEVSDIDSLIGVLNDLEIEGKINGKGISLAKGHPYEEDVIRAFDVVQNDANLLYTESLKSEWISDIHFMARSPLASGILAGTKDSSTTFVRSDHRSGWLKDERLVSLLKRVAVIQGLSDIPIASIARRFLLNHPDVDSVIFGVKRPEHVDDIVSDMESPSLPSSFVENLIDLIDNDFGLVNESHLGY